MGEGSSAASSNTNTNKQGSPSNPTKEKAPKAFPKRCPICKQYSRKVHNRTFLVDDDQYCAIYMGVCCYHFTSRLLIHFPWKVQILQKLTRAKNCTDLTDQHKEKQKKWAHKPVCKRNISANDYKHFPFPEEEFSNFIKRTERRGSGPPIPELRLCAGCRFKVIGDCIRRTLKEASSIKGNKRNYMGLKD